ncbi:hypothetical protein BFAG_04131 [Bacteroides fragilis 3_1_12]|uniref:Uncharacterized protein n=1 Tax=Bacteroides fragilis 3_1_12 TaxID=457424 RepID=A0ABN0BRD1_BACFG|nr:hypothetical protein BFAG_04131 [Bacteroides fragilis 3_1_12]
MKHLIRNSAIRIRFTFTYRTVLPILLLPDRRKDFFIHVLHLGEVFWRGQEFASIHSIRIRKVLDFFPGSCIPVNACYVKIILVCPLLINNENK